MSVSYGKGDKGKATKLHSVRVRELGFCESCGESEYSKLQAAHIVGRRYSATRTLVSNAFCLCASCHRKFTDWPREFSRFITGTWAQEYYDVLAYEARQASKVDWSERLEVLKSYKGLPVAEMRVRDHRLLTEGRA